MNPRFKAYLLAGGDRAKLWLFMAFIQEAKGLGIGVAKTARGEVMVVDHDEFTRACWILSLAKQVERQEGTRP